MKVIQRLIFMGLMSMFPVSVYLFTTWTKDGAAKAKQSEAEHQGLFTFWKKSEEKSIKQGQESAVDTGLIEQAINQKVKEIEEIEVRTLAAEGELMRYREQKANVIKDLEKLRDRILPIIERSKTISNRTDHEKDPYE